MNQIATQHKQNLLVGDAVISIQGDLYSLNDLHRASGGHPNHQPSNFLKLEGTQELAREISKEINQSYDSMTGVLEVVRGGNNPGTYVCKELVYAYAMWVSAAFNLRVIRAFDAGVSAPALPDFSNPAEAARAWAAQYEQRLALEAKVAEDAPKVEFYHDVTGSDSVIDMATVAKVLNRGIGRNRLFAFLRDEGVLDARNAPYQRFIDMGWFRQVETKWQKPNGDWQIGIKTVVFQKGVEGIARLLDRKEAA